MAYFPFMIDIADKNALVVGGGKIAFHKVKILYEFDVNIKVIAVSVCEEMKRLARQQEEGQHPITIVEREFDDDDIDGMDFVIAATNDRELNFYISDLCRQKHVLMNAVDMKEACSFIFPAMIKQNDFLVSVSTGGNSPAAAAYVKQQIQKNVPDYYGDMIDTLGNYREEIFRKVDIPGQRKEIFQRLLAYGDAHKGRIPAEIVEQTICEMIEAIRLSNEEK